MSAEGQEVLGDSHSIALEDLHPDLRQRRFGVTAGRHLVVLLGPTLDLAELSPVQLTTRGERQAVEEDEDVLAHFGEAAGAFRSPSSLMRAATAFASSASLYASSCQPIVKVRTGSRLCACMSATTVHVVATAPDDDIEDDLQLREDALRVLDEGQPDLLLVHLPDVDHVAHAEGVGEHHDVVARRADDIIAEIVAASDPQTTFVLTSDHGHVDRGGHGGSETEATITPLVLSGPVVGVETVYAEHRLMPTIGDFEALSAWRTAGEPGSKWSPPPARPTCSLSRVAAGGSKPPTTDPPTPIPPSGP